MFKLFYCISNCYRIESGNWNEKSMCFVLLVMFSVFNVSAKERVFITDIKCSNMIDGKVNVNGLNIDVEDTKFGIVEDYMKCTLGLNNNFDDSVSSNETLFLKCHLL